jgi:hypothetical protein
MLLDWRLLNEFEGGEYPFTGEKTTSLLPQLLDRLPPTQGPLAPAPGPPPVRLSTASPCPRTAYPCPMTSSRPLPDYLPGAHGSPPASPKSASSLTQDRPPLISRTNMLLALYLPFLFWFPIRRMREGAAEENLPAHGPGRQPLSCLARQGTPRIWLAYGFLLR